MFEFRIRIAGKLDLPYINTIIDRAVSSWDTTERVKRLATTVHRYRPDDINHMWLLAAERHDGVLVGVAALEEADDTDMPSAGHGVLLHGIYVEPEAMGSGVGKALLNASAGIALHMGYRGLLVKAVRQSTGFFEHCGMLKCHAERDSDYPYRYWLSTGPHDSAPVASGTGWGKDVVQLRT